MKLNPSQFSNVEAETAVLGSLLLDPGRIEDFMEIGLAAGHFASPVHGGIYDAVLSHACTYGWESLDESRIRALVLDRISLKKLDSQALVVLDQARNAIGADIDYFARQIIDYAIKRYVEVFSQQLIDRLGSNTGEGVLEWASNRIYQLSTGNQTAGAFNNRVEETAEAVKRLTVLPPDQDPESGKWLTGFRPFDDLVRCKGGDLVIIAARPSVGKTAIALNMAEQIARRMVAVSFFSLEMPGVSLRERLISSVAEVDMFKCTRGGSNYRDRENIHKVVPDVETLPIDIYDRPPINEVTIRSAVRQWVTRNKNAQWVFIDYLQIMSAADRYRDNRQQEIAHLSRCMKSIANEFGVCLVVLSQFNREMEKTSRRPMMSDLKESGQIEQDADIIMCLHRPKSEEGQKDVKKIELICMKNRNGPLGSQVIEYHGKHLQFKPIKSGVNDAEPF